MCVRARACVGFIIYTNSRNTRIYTRRVCVRINYIQALLIQKPQRTYLCVCVLCTVAAVAYNRRAAYMEISPISVKYITVPALSTRCADDFHAHASAKCFLLLERTPWHIIHAV